MGLINIEKYFRFTRDQITDDEKENLCDDICSFEVSEEIDRETTIKLFKITQEILKFKAEQVESLTTELDNLAVKLGEEEAKRSQSYVDVQDLKSISSKNDSDDKLSDNGDYQRKLMKMEIQKERLVEELQEKEQELSNERKEVEKLTSKLSTLEEANKNLRNEFQAMQQELASNTNLKLYSDDQDYMPMEKYHELSELLRQKNKHITQLLNDIEDIEKENINLKNKLSNVRDELAEGVEQMSKLSMERISLSTRVEELQGKQFKLEQENLGLRNQIVELVADKEKRDKQFEAVNTSFDAKIRQLKDALERKELELTTLKFHNGNIDLDTTDGTDHLAHLNRLNRSLAERDEKLLELQQQLQQATMDLNETTRLLEEQKELVKLKMDKSLEPTIIKQLKKKLEQAESRVNVLEARAKFAEEESLRKAEEVTELIIQLREYESGTYGLEEAMIRIKEVEKQKQVRNAQIEQLIQSSNELQDEINVLEHENQILREKLGITPEQDVVDEGLTHRHRSRQNKLLELERDLEKCRDELLSAKLQNRKLTKELSKLHTEMNFCRLSESIITDTHQNTMLSDYDLRSDSKNRSSVAVQSSFEDKPAGEVEETDRQFKDLIEENESLRQGLHEILESIENRDSYGVIQIESEILERLLEALDSRHINGWYQPAMRLQAQIHRLYGTNKTLRQELHIHRIRENELFDKLQDIPRKILPLQDSTAQIHDSVASADKHETGHASKRLMKSVSCDGDTRKIYDVQKELKNEQEKNKKLESEIKQIHDELLVVKEDMENLHEQYRVDKESWQDVKLSAEKETTNVRNEAAALRLKVNDYENSLEILKQSPHEIEKCLADMTLKLADLKVELQQQSRKYNCLLEMETHMREERDEIFKSMYSTKFAKEQELVELRKLNNELEVKLQNKEMSASASIKKNEHDKVVNDLNDFIIKYREVQHKQIVLQSEKDKLVMKLQTKVSSLLSQKTELEMYLKESIEETNHLRFCTSSNSTTEEVKAMSKKIATLEVDLINQKQYSSHLNRMYDLSKEQLTETEKRCKRLEEQLSSAIESNCALQKVEADLREKVVQFEMPLDYEELASKLDDAQNNVALLNGKNVELEELASIARDQIEALEKYNRHRNYEYDSLQRRLLELQSLSDEKVIIDRLTKELLLAQNNGVNNNMETTRLQNELTKSETEILQVKVKLNELESEYNKLKKDTNVRMRTAYDIIRELQKRYLGYLPLVKVELYCDNIMKCKEECYTLTSLVLDLKYSSILSMEEKESDDSENRINDKKYRHKFKMQDFSIRLINEGLHNKIQIYAERLERQDRLITRLEEEIIHADEQCQEFLLYWSPQVNSKTLIENYNERLDHKFTQTEQTEKKLGLNTEKFTGEPNDELNQASKTIEFLRETLRSMENDLVSARDEVANLTTDLKLKDQIIAEKERQIANLTKINSHFDEDRLEAGNKNENAINKMALKTTIDSLQNIIEQKEEIIVRLQNKLKETGDEHTQNVYKLVKEIKILQNSVSLKEQACDRLEQRLNLDEKTPNEKRKIIDSYLTKIHELEDELNQSNDKIEQLSNQLTDSNQEVALWSHTAEERLKTLQDMKHELDTKPISQVNMNTTDKKLPHNSLMQIVKEKMEENEKLKQTVEELKKRLGSGEKLPGYRDRLKNQLEIYKRKIELLEQKEKEDKSEIQKLKNQIVTRPQSARKKETLVTPKEEQLIKKIKSLENQLDECEKREIKWRESHKAKVNEEIEKWESKKRFQQTCNKLRQQLKEQSTQYESLKLNNDRLKETIIRLEKERMTLDSKLKAATGQTSSMSLIEELHKANHRLEEEVRILRLSAELPMGATSLNNVIEAQERKIKALEIARKGDSALAEEIEKLNERKSQLQKYNLHLEEENSRLKSEIEKLKFSAKVPEIFDSSEPHHQRRDVEIKDEKKRNMDLEKAVLVLKRVVEKLQAENKRLYNCKVSKVQEKSDTEKVQNELQNLQKNYLDAIEKISSLNKELQNAHYKIESLQKLINRLQNGEEFSVLRSQILEKNHLLAKVKNLLQKAAKRERELMMQVQDLRTVNSAQ